MIVAFLVVCVFLTTGSAAMAATPAARVADDNYEGVGSGDGEVSLTESSEVTFSSVTNRACSRALADDAILASRDDAEVVPSHGESSNGIASKNWRRLIENSSLSGSLVMKKVESGNVVGECHLIGPSWGRKVNITVHKEVRGRVRLIECIMGDSHRCETSWPDAHPTVSRTALKDGRAEWRLRFRGKALPGVFSCSATVSGEKTFSLSSDKYSCPMRIPLTVGCYACGRPVIAATVGLGRWETWEIVWWYQVNSLGPFYRVASGTDDGPAYDPHHVWISPDRVVPLDELQVRRIRDAQISDMDPSSVLPNRSWINHLENVERRGFLSKAGRSLTVGLRMFYAPGTYRMELKMKRSGDVMQRYLARIEVPGAKDVDAMCYREDSEGYVERHEPCDKPGLLVTRFSNRPVNDALVWNMIWCTAFLIAVWCALMAWTRRVEKLARISGAGDRDLAVSVATEPSTNYGIGSAIAGIGVMAAGTLMGKGAVVSQSRSGTYFGCKSSRGEGPRRIGGDIKGGSATSSQSRIITVRQCRRAREAIRSNEQFRSRSSSM